MQLTNCPANYVGRISVHEHAEAQHHQRITLRSGAMHVGNMACQVVQVTHFVTADSSTSWLRDVPKADAPPTPAKRERYLNAHRRVADGGGKYKLPYL